MVSSLSRPGRVRPGPAGDFFYRAMGMIMKGIPTL